MEGSPDSSAPAQKNHIQFYAQNLSQLHAKKSLLPPELSGFRKQSRGVGRPRPMALRANFWFGAQELMGQ